MVTIPATILAPLVTILQLHCDTLEHLTATNMTPSTFMRSCTLREEMTMPMMILHKWILTILEGKLGNTMTENLCIVMISVLDSRSIIITGCSQWTIYEDADYQGYSLCLSPRDPENCYPGLYPYPADLGYFAGKTSSVRKGCLTNNILAPVAIPEGKIVTRKDLRSKKGV